MSVYDTAVEESDASTANNEQTDLWTYGQQAADRADTCPNGRELCDGPDSEELGCLGCFEVDGE